ncbi:MAG: hypothetical protein HW405_678 [Candidatus Berkelbacteria bacterium]|nr:hypothetical protein [Candidatus Berkelbacteria bacterium]
MHCPKCGSIIKDKAESCKFCKTTITAADREKELSLRPTPRPKELKEIKNTCQGCGHTWFYDRSDQLKNFGEKMDVVSDDLVKTSCCCLFFPLGFLTFLIPKKKVIDLNRCPKCGSKAIKKETVTHNI